MSDVSFVVGDTAPSLSGALTDAAGNPRNLTGVTVKFQMRNTLDRRWSVDGTAAIVSYTGGTVRYDWAPGDLSEAGTFESRWQLLVGGSIEHTEPGNTITVEAA